MPRISTNDRSILNHHPFSGRGASLYRNELYRRIRLIPVTSFINQGFAIGATNVTKTARIAHVTGVEGEAVDLVADLTDDIDSTITLDVRTFVDNIECETFNPQEITLDSGGEIDPQIEGLYSLITTEIRSGGVIRFRFQWIAAETGVSVEQFRITRTAGPTSPADVVESADGTGVYEIDTTALDDSAPYTFDIFSENTTESVTKVLDTITVTSDATGPTVPTSVTAEAS